MMEANALAVRSNPVTRVSLVEALALGPLVWDDLMTRAGCASPFMSWAWHRAWADAAPPAEAGAGEVLTLPDSGSLQAVLPLPPGRLPFRRITVSGLTWAIGAIGCPDELDVPALPARALRARVQAIEDRLRP